MTQHLPPLPGVKAQIDQDFMPDDRLKIAKCNGDPLQFLEQVMDSPRVSLRARMQAAMCLMPFKYPKLGEEGKKGKQQSRAGEVSIGRFKARPAPGATPTH